LTVFAWALTFPGVFGPTRLLGGFQSTPYLYFFWHIGFPIFVIAYALSKDTDLSRRSWDRRARARIALSATLTVSLVIAAASFFILGNAVLPQIQVDPLRLSSVGFTSVCWSISLPSSCFGRGGDPYSIFG
jgi:hypothetical protein